MTNSIGTKSKKIVSVLLFSLIIAGVSYLLVYKASFLPNGYDIISHQENSITIKKYNILGVNEGISTLSFSNDDLWKKDEIVYQVKRYKDFLWLLITFVSISLSLLIYKIRKGMKWGKALLESNIIFAVLIPTYSIINSLNMIHDLIY